MTSVREAARRGDLGRLSAHLRAHQCTSDEIRLLVRHDDPRLRHLGLDHLAARVDRPGAEPAGLAALLPDTVDGPPETALLLAHLHQRLWPHVAEQRRPDWRAADLPVTVRIAWLRAEIVNRPATVHTEPSGELLHQAVAGITAADAARPRDLLRELAAAHDPLLRAAALRLAREALHAALLSPAHARALLEGLLDAAPGDVLPELAEPWAALSPLPRHRLDPFAHLPAAIGAAARHGHGDLLWEVVADETMPPRSRQEALRALGDLADRGDIPDITGAGAADPLLLAEPATTCLRAMHRRGHLPAGADAAPVVALALADHRIAAAEVATILYTCRHEAFRALTATDPDDPLWPRRLDLLVGLAGQGGGDLPVGEAVTAMLPTASHPEPFLYAIRTLRHRPAEAAVLALLPRFPEAALHALEAVGGEQTVTVLEESLGPIVPSLYPVRHRALELLWHLTGDPDRRRAILARLHPHDLPPRIMSDLGAADPREPALLRVGADPGDPVRALVTLARHGDTTTLPAISDILLRIVAELTGATPASSVRPAAAPMSGGARDSGAVAGGPPAGEPTVPDEVVAAIRALGVRLHERGTLRPFCLREAADARAAGNALVATVALDLLDRPDLSPAEQAILLNLLRQAPYPGTRARVHRLLRHRDRHVRKHVIALLATDASDVDALSASLIVLTAARDAETVRQALLALDRAGARWAAPAVAACLDHPAMNVKKTAAAALTRCGTPAAVPKLLFWLGHHDNPGLRLSLVRALRAILGPAYPATVLAAAEQTGDHRTRELLLGGLSRMLPARAVNALADQGSPVAAGLLTMIVSGRIRLASGTVEDLAGQLTAHGITLPATPQPDTDDDIDALLLHGWDAAIARRLVNRQPELMDHRPPPVTRQPELVDRRPPPVNREPELVDRRPPPIARQPELADRRPPPVNRQPEPVDRRPPPVTQRESLHRQPEAGDRQAESLARLRPLLADWLNLAGADPSIRPATLRFVVRLCPPPWTADELTAFTRAAGTLVDGLSDTTGADRDGLLAILEAVAPGLDAARAFDLAGRIRTVEPTAAGRRSALPLLRRCGAVLTRADVDHALAAAGLGPDPWLAEARVLHEAFTPPPTSPSRPATSEGAGAVGEAATVAVGRAGAGVETATVAVGRAGVETATVAVGRAGVEAATVAVGGAGVEAATVAVGGAGVEAATVAVRGADVTEWRAGLEAAVRDRGTLDDFRSHDDGTVASRERLRALIDVFPSAGREVRPALLDWMGSLQPVGAPSWTLGEDARRPRPASRTPHDGDLDQPRSAAQRDRLLALLDAPTADRRDTAAAALSSWPEPAVAGAVLRAYLDGRADVTATASLAGALTRVDEGELEAGDAVRERAARVAYHLDPAALRQWIPRLVRWWEQGGPECRAAAERALRRFPEHGDVIAVHLRDRLAAGAWGLLGLITGRPLLRTPDLTAMCRRLRDEGRDDLAARIGLVDGPVRDTAAAAGDAAALATLRERPQPASGPGGPSRDELFQVIRTGQPEQARRALTRLAEAFEDRPATRDPEFEELLAALLHHPEPRLRMHAHRIGRKVLDRPTYLRQTAVLLDDPEPDVVRAAVKTLGHAGYEAAVPAIVGLLTHRHPTVRRTAASALIGFGRAAVPALISAVGRARPDKRRLYRDVLDRITRAR